MNVKAVNNHDTTLFPESFQNLIETSALLGFGICNSFLTLDSGFDSLNNKANILSHGLIPVIMPNLRNTKDPEKKDSIMKKFELFKNVYKERYKIERCFAWQDVYRKLVVRYERLQCTHLGFKYLAYTMINYRSIFQTKC